LCIAAREAARVSSCDNVPWCSKSFSPRRGRVGWSEVLEIISQRIVPGRATYRESEDRKRKSWVSSDRSISVVSGVARMAESSSASAILVVCRLQKTCRRQFTSQTIGKSATRRSIDLHSFQTLCHCNLLPSYCIFFQSTPRLDMLPVDDQLRRKPRNP